MLGNPRVTTLSPPSDWAVERYFGLVTAHVVAGTGFLSDFVASLTDFFGGRSGTYQRQLAAIESEAVEQIWLQASRRGANWVVGVRLDFDQLSGKNMQMLMVSAVGTAVLARHASDSASSAVTDMALPASAVRRQVERLMIMDRVRAGLRTMDDTTWAALSEHRIVDAVPAIVDRVHQGVQDLELRQRALEFLRCLPIPELQDRLHRLLAESAEMEFTIVDLIVELNLVDLRWVDDHLAGADPRLRLAAFRLLKGYAPSYGRSDVATIKSIRARLSVGLPEVVQVVQPRGAFSRVFADDRWRCVCGEEWGVVNDRCVECGRDRRGLRVQDLSPEKIDDHLRLQAASLEALTSAETGA